VEGNVNKRHQENPTEGSAEPDASTRAGVPASVPTRAACSAGQVLRASRAPAAARPSPPACCAGLQAGRPLPHCEGMPAPAVPAAHGAGAAPYLWAALGALLGFTASAVHHREGLTPLGQGFLVSPSAFCCMDKTIPQRQILSATATHPQVQGKVREIKGLHANCSSKTRQGLCCACSECFGVTSHQLSKLAGIRACETRKLKQYTSDSLQQNLSAAKQKCTWRP